MQNNNSCPGVELLLINYSTEKVDVQYATNPNPFKLPKIGIRPPYFYNARCEESYPII
jgi:hypothetical protein